VGWDSSVGIATCYGIDVPGSKPSGGEIFHTHPASYTMGTRSFPRAKWTRHGIHHPPQSSAQVKESVRLHLYPPFGPLWPVPG